MNGQQNFIRNYQVSPFRGQSAQTGFRKQYGNKDRFQKYGGAGH